MTARRILIGKNSQLWQALVSAAGVAGAFDSVLSHGDVSSIAFSASDEVWVLSYSRQENENYALLDAVAKAGRIVYFSSATANIVPVTRCYRYPSVKAAAADYARSRHGATIVHLGYVYSKEADLPGGLTAAISLRQVADTFRHGIAPETRDLLLFEMIERPYRHWTEAWLHKLYDLLQRACGGYPCLLRPLDVLLRAAGFRWYGYMNLSNRQWLTTIS